MRAWALALFLGLALAGCFGGDDGTDPSGSPSASSGPTGSPTGSTSPGPTTAPSPSPSPSPVPDRPGNRAPNGVILATGGGPMAPVTVNFTLDANDVNGDSLAWTFDADGDGEDDFEGTEADLPYRLNFTYFAGGVFNATLTVDDSLLQDVDVLAIDLQPPVPPPPPPYFLFQGTTEQSCLFCSGDPVLGFVAAGSNGCLGFDADRQGLDCVWTAFPEQAEARPYSVTSTVGDPDLEFRSECSPSPTEDAIRVANVGGEAGTVPRGYLCVVLWEFGLDPSTITFRVEK